MLEIDIPGFRSLRIKNLALDFNGTISKDGKLIPKAGRKIDKLSKRLKIYVLTADTYGRAKKELGNVHCEVHILKGKRIDLQKAKFIRKLGSAATASIGNGNNDRKMLEISGLGIAVMGEEGCAVSALSAADIVMADISGCLDLLLKPKRALATLRLSR